MMIPSALLGLMCCLSWVGQDSSLPALRFIQPDEKTGTSRAVVVDEVGLVHTSQFFAWGRDGTIPSRSPASQARQIYMQLTLSLQIAGVPLERIAKLNVYAANLQAVGEVRKLLAEQFRGKAGPAVCYVVGALPHPDALVAMDAVAALGPVVGGVSRQAPPVTRVQFNPGSPLTIAPSGPRVYIAGQAEKGTLPEATRRTMESLLATLKFLNLDKSRVVQVKAFLNPMTSVKDAEKEIVSFFTGQAIPSLVFVEWKSSLPIEIELIASAPPPKEKPADAIDFLTPPGMKASPIYSRVTRINYGKTVYVSGLYGLTAKDATGEVEEIFATLGDVLKKSGSDFRHLAKATYYVSRDDTSAKLNELRPKYYDPKRPPSASKAMVPGVGVEGRGITLDMIAVVKP